MTDNHDNTGMGIHTLPLNHPVQIAVIGQPSVTDVLRALDLLSGGVHPSAAGVMLDESRYVRDAVLGRASQGLGGAGALAALGPTMPAIAYAQETEEAFAALGYAADGKRSIYKAPAVTPNQRVLTTWAQAIGAFGHADALDNAAPAERRVAGLITGLDATFNNTWRVGLAAGYTRSELDVDDHASSAGIDNIHAALYGAGQFGPWGVRGGTAFTAHSIETNRTIAFLGFFDRTKADYDARTVQAFGELGYAVAVGPAALEPFAQAAYVNLHTDGFVESGGAAALTAGDQSLESTFTTLGLRVAGVIGLIDGMTVTARGMLGWRHAFGDVVPVASLAFASGGAPFMIAGVPIARDSAIVEAGFDLDVRPNIRLGLAYSGQLADHAQDHAVKGQFTWRF